MLQYAFAICLWVLSAGLSNRNELFEKYGEVFPHGNRNAASHRWATYILERSREMTEEVMRDLFAGFCPVSGSPLDYNRPVSRWNMTLLDAATGGTTSGALYYCCWPCVCDTQDFIHVDTKSVQTSDGEKQYQWVVIGNPCAKPEAIPMAAPDVNCEGDELVKATLSDNGHVIIGMFFEPGVPGHTDENSQMTQMDVLSDHCQARADSGHQSGMGMIFREVANISPIVATAEPTPSETDDADPEGNRVAAAPLDASTTTITLTTTTTVDVMTTTTADAATTTTAESTGTTITATSTTTQTSTGAVVSSTTSETTRSATEVQSTTSGTSTTSVTSVQNDAAIASISNAAADADPIADTTISPDSGGNDQTPSTSTADEGSASTRPQRPGDYIPASADTLSAAYAQHPLLGVALTVLANTLLVLVLC